MTEKIDIKKVLEEGKPLVDAAIQKYFPRQYDEKSLEFVCGKPRYAYDVDTATKAVSAPVWDLLDRGGKRWRPALFLLCCEALGGDTEKVKDFVVIPEVVHNGSLMIDDIEDSSKLRRGQPCTYKKFGVDVAINAGNCMYFQPVLVFVKNRGKFPDKILLRAYEIYVQELTNIHYGQGFDIWWHKGNKRDVTEQEYLQMCAYKTGTLARLSAKLGALFAGGSEKEVEALGKFAEAIGVAFQIQDDILNLVGEEFAKGKGVGEDVHEGKHTLIVIHALSKASARDKARLIEILDSHPSDEKTILEAIAIFRKYGSIDYAAKRAAEIVREAWNEVDSLLKPSPAKRKLEAFANYLVERKI
ncbi:MAG: polyprenyl synthetase family protein [Candidatus Micrarchaeia archaeon]